VRLVAVAVCLLAVGAAVLTGATALVARGHLTEQADQQLRAYVGSLTSQPFEVNPLGGLSPGTPVAGTGAFSIEVRGPGGQLVLRAAPGSRPAQVLPPISARAGRLVTATARGGESWRVITEPIRYRARRILFAYSPQDFSLAVTGHGRAGMPGTLVVGIGLAGVGQAAGRLVTTGLAVSGVTVLAVACLSALLIRAVRRYPAGAGQAGTSAGQPGPALAGTRPEYPGTQAEHPGTQAEHPGTSGEQPPLALADTCRELRKPISVIHGLARDYQRRGPPSAADADQMMARVASEAQRMEALLAGLPPTPGEPAGHCLESRAET
jgi:hypothetical protein